MNIFVTDPSPVVSANYLDIKRANKMIVESTQMLCTAINTGGGTTPYKSINPNHPCNIWARASLCNWLWLYEHAMALGVRYMKRTGRIHKSHQVLMESGLILLAYEFVPHGNLTPFHNSTTNFKHIDNVIEAYRLQMAYKWEHDIRKPVFELAT